MLTSRSSPSVVTSVDTGPPQELNPSKSDDHLQKKRGRFFSRLFQVKKSIKSTNSASDSGNVAASTSGLRKHAMSSSRSDSSSPPATPTTTATASSSSMEPSFKRLLRDVVTSTTNAIPVDETRGVIFIQSADAAVPVAVTGPANQQMEADSWKEQLDKLALTASTRQKQQQDVGVDCTWKQAVPLAISISRAWVRNGGSTVVPGPSFTEINKNDHLSCPKCGGVLHQVVTLACGHSFCRKCASALDRCSKCSRTDVIQPDLLKTNVTISTLVDKWWPNEVKAIELRNAGNQTFAEQHYDQALEKYNQGAQIGERKFLRNLFPTLFFLFLEEVVPLSGIDSSTTYITGHEMYLIRLSTTTLFIFLVFI